ncbi:MAG: hypothetical protein QNJ92_06835 [Alphaproteobacteria bacterium]|nr:hypothetical protein [Alphaproteobacteria bacterium]
MTYEFRDGARSNAKPLIGLYSQSGAGKTYSALLLARGFVGPQGTIGMIETESGRGEAYADPAEYPEIGGYKVLSLRDNFSPEEYGKAITAAEKAGLDALIIDSASHEWEGTGGVLSMAADNQAANRKGPLVWQQPKQLHKRHFMLRFMQTPIPLVILCMRARHIMREVEGRGGKKEWVRDDNLTPTQADDILFEMFVHGWIGQDHNFHLTKCTARKLEPVFQTGKPLSIETGQQLAKWAAGTDMPEKAEGAPSESASPSLIDRAREAAAGGLEAYRAFFGTLKPSEKRQIQPHHEALKASAEAADEEEDIPFDAPEDDASPPAQPDGSQMAATDNGQVAEMPLRYIGLDGSVSKVESIADWRVGLATEVSVAGENKKKLADLEKSNADIFEELRINHPADVKAVERMFMEASGQQAMAV